MSFTDLLSVNQASGRPTRGRTPIYRLMIEGVLEDLSVTEAAFVFGEGIHDSASLSVTSTERTSTEGIVDKPISFFFGSAPRSEIFCGYITKVTEEQTDAGVLAWKMDVMGATKPMQVGTPRYWTGKTIPRAVRDLTHAAYLGYTGHAQGYRWPALAQTSESSWKTACQFASRLGWSLFNRYGIVMCYDPLLLFQESGAYMSLISETYNIARTEIDDERSLLQFDPSEESEDTIEQYGYKVGYFQDRAVQIATQRGRHASYRFMAEMVARNAEEAQIYVESEASDASGWPQHAMARILGNAALYPGMCVDVLTTDQRYYRGKFNGRWLILAVNHAMDRQSFQSNLALVRPADHTQVYDGGYDPFWQRLGRARPMLTINEDKWVSSWANPTVAAVT